MVTSIVSLLPLFMSQRMINWAVDDGCLTKRADSKERRFKQIPSTEAPLIMCLVSRSIDIRAQFSLSIA